MVNEPTTACARRRGWLSLRRSRPPLGGLLLVGAAVACGPWASPGQTGGEAVAPLEARCVRVDDGDSLRVIVGEREARVRLHGIDCPEKGQPFGDEARDFTRARALDRDVTLEVVDADRYGRLLAKVHAGDVDLNLELVAAGLAWHSTLHSSDPALAAAQQAAQREGRGLWADRDPIPPWTFRRQQREARETPPPTS